MARYIDADKVMEEIANTGGHNLCEWSTLGVKALIDRQPTADVAPRAEIDKLQEVNADLNESLRIACERNKDLQAKVDRWRFGLEAVLEERAEDRAEVAREIFEEMDEIMLPLLHEVSQVYIYVKLKRKHTQPEPPEGD